LWYVKVSISKILFNLDKFSPLNSIKMHALRRGLLPTKINERIVAKSIMKRNTRSARFINVIK